MGIAVPFPDSQPPGYDWFDAEPVFNPEIHLALEHPSEIVMLADIGYEDHEIATKATPVALSTPFRILSDEGAETMLEVARRLRQYNRPAGERIERMTRGGCYRSRWLRDLCISPELADHMSLIYRVPVAPHIMGLHLGHLNYDPSTLDRAIDRWHHDTLPLDFVMMVTDPNAVAGGQFEYFVGTKHEAADLAAKGELPPPSRVVAPRFDGAGYAIALHGDMVVHRGAQLEKLSERISMVNGYVAMDPGVDHQSRNSELISVDDHNVLWVEWAKMAAWRSYGRLGELVKDLDFSQDREAIIVQLRSAIADVEVAIDEMESATGKAHHYGG